MVNTVLASLALFGASVSALGRAHIVNKCSYDVFMCETPAEGGGYSVVEKTMSPGDEWDQEYTPLSNNAGWSIKLSRTEGAFGHNILQFEYCYQNDHMIWYDLSAVDGDAFDGDWKMTSDSDTCNPKQQAYRHPTDDEWGMQSCNSDASITVTLCPGETSDDSPASYSSASSAAVLAASSYAASPTTFATLTTAASSHAKGAVVTVTEIVTEVATATQYAKRHQHRGAHERA